jgi:TolB-like protein/DNA-binding SARP family transcriptional activator
LPVIRDDAIRPGAGRKLVGMLELRVLGSLDLVGSDDGASLRSVLAQPKRTALLVYLAVEAPPGTFHRRDSLLATFWPERDRAHARNALNQSLHFLRRSLGSEVIEARGREEVGAADVLWCDAAAFRDALEEGERERALELYRGDFLEGFHLTDAPPFERWVDRLRSRLRSQAREAALELAGAAESVAAARRWLERALEIAPTDEEVVRRLMELQDEAGDRAGALRAYEVLATRLERTLGVEPSPETRALAEAIRERDRVHRAGAPVPGTAADSESAAGRDGQPGDQSEVEEAGPPASPEAREASRKGHPEGVGTSPDARFRRLRRRAVGTVALVVVGAGLALTTGLLDPDGPPGGTAAARFVPSVAVLPFDDLSPEAEDRYLADGITEDVMIALARIGGLGVTSRTSVMNYRDRREPVEEVAAELGVTHVVEGTVRRSDDRIVITAQLIDARTDRHLWARTYDRSSADLLDVQREVARAIARELPVEISPEAAEEADRSPTRDGQAYDLFLRGREYQTRDSGDPGDNNRFALRMFDQALERDSSFAEAWARAVESHLNLYQWSAERADERVELAREAAEHALAADPGGAWGHWALADLHFRATRDPEATLRHLEAAETAGLATGELLGRKAAVLRRKGRLEASAELFERARALDPLNEDLAFQSWTTYLGLRRYDEAQATLERVLELAPDHRTARRYLSRLPLLRDGDAEAVGPPASREWETLWRLDDYEAALAVEGPSELPGHEGRTRARRGLIHLETGDTVAARAAFDSARTLLGEALRQETFTQGMRWIGIAGGGLGDGEGALEAARRAVEVAERRRGVPSVPRFYLGLVQAMVGHEEDALATLEEYLANPGGRSFRNVATHPLVEPLHDHPDFGELERRFSRTGDSARGAPTPPPTPSP